MVGWSGPAGAIVPALPAAMPATCVPWNEMFGTNASRPWRPEFGPGNARATMIFPFTHVRPPRGKPAGYE